MRDIYEKWYHLLMRSTGLIKAVRKNSQGAKALIAVNLVRCMDV